MLPSSGRSLVWLALLTGCVGAVGGPSEEARFDAASRELSEAGVGDDSASPHISGDASTAAPLVCADGSAGSLAAGLHIREVALYQTVEIPLYRDGVWLVDRGAPIVQRKRALVRVFVDTLAGYAPRDVRAVLRLHDDGVSSLLVEQRALRASSSDAQLGSTFNFQVAPEQLGPLTELSVSLEEPSCERGTGAAIEARVPEAGAAPLGAVAIDALHVVVVPVRTDGRVPLTNEAELNNMKQALLAHYPVPDVELRVREPLDWTEPLDPQGGDTWSTLLNQIEQARRVDDPPSNVYYFGLVQPAVSAASYCFSSCALGLAHQNVEALPDYQAALGASFGDEQTYLTIVHELGHAHGRAHAPCSPDGNIAHRDPDFPDSKGATASWGWDSRNNSLEPPSTKDVMGYCNPTWMGQYTYSALAARSQLVNGALARSEKSVQHSTQGAWKRVILYSDQTARWGGPVAAPAPGARVELAQALDSAGRVLAQVEVVRVGLSQGAAGFLNIPTPEPPWAALQLADRKLVLSTIAAAAR